MWGRKSKKQQESRKEPAAPAPTSEYSTSATSDYSSHSAATTDTATKGSDTDDTGSSEASGGIAPQFKKLGVADLGLNQAQLVKYKDVFDAFKNPKTGRVTPQTLGDMVRKLGKSITQAEAQSMIEDVGSAKSVTGITFAEFCQMMADMLNQRLKIITAAFRVIDENGMGFITAEHLCKAVKIAGMRLSNDQVDGMIDHATEEDVRFVNFETFAKMMGFQGSVPTDMLNTTLVSQSEITMFSESMSADESMLDEAFILKFSEISVKFQVFYLGEGFVIKAHGKTKLSTVAQKVAKHLKHPADKLRFYYRGFVMLEPQKTLAQYLVKSDPIMVLLLPAGEPLAHELCWEDTPDSSATDSTGEDEGTDSSGFFGSGNGETTFNSTRIEEDTRPILKHIYTAFRRESLLRVEDALQIARRARRLMEREENLIYAEEPVSVIGDIHGQFFDLDQIFQLGGSFSTEHTHLFLGDYVDRGYFSCEVILFLLAAKIVLPKNVLLLRGNHESRKMTKTYGFYEECVYKYSEAFYEELMRCFDALPLACVVSSGGKKLLMVHGGISPRIESLSDIENVDRFHEPPMEGLLREILWTDPWDDELQEKGERPESYNLTRLKKAEKTKKKDKAGDKPYADLEWFPSDRSRSLMSYGHASLCHFLAKNNLISIFRAHEQKLYGHEVYKDGPVYKFPAVVTVFSAPNYTDKSMNDGTVAVFEEGILSFVSYKWRLHPIYFPHSGGKKKKRGTKDLRTEDFIQYVNWLHPESLFAAPMATLKKEWYSVFLHQRQDGLEGSESEESSDGGSSGSTTSTTSKSSSSRATQYWKELSQNLMALLAQSTDPEIVKLLKRKSKALMVYYEEFDHFAESLSSESVYERDFDSPEVQSRVDTAYASDYVYFVSPRPEKVLSPPSKKKGKLKNKRKQAHKHKDKDKHKDAEPVEVKLLESSGNLERTHSDGIIADMMKQQRGQTHLMEPYSHGSSSATVAYKKRESTLGAGSFRNLRRKRRKSAAPEPTREVRNIASQEHSSRRRKRSNTFTGQATRYHNKS